jgi:hypothetical protein
MCRSAARRHPQHGARLPVHLLVLQPMEILARLPGPRPKEGGRRDRGAGEGAPGRLLHPRRRGTHHQPQEVHPVLPGADRPRLPDKVCGASTPASPTSARQGTLPFYRKAGLVHISLGTEAAAQLKLDLFNKETKVEENKRAIRLLREADIVTEAQFIVGLENETVETLEETYQMARDWQPDLANWAMYTPWPFSDLFKELGDKVEIFDFEKYNFVTPIMKPEAMDRANCLTG